MGYHEWKKCIDACLNCAALCNHCMSECIKEPEITSMRECIALDMQCARICMCAAELMSMGSPHARVLCGICADICEKCAAECRKHEMQHCQECARACADCAEICRDMAA